MKKENISIWLRKEAERIDEDIEKLKIKIKKLMLSENINYLDKINQYNMQLREFKASQHKLYEMIGRIDEIDSVM